MGTTKSIIHLAGSSVYFKNILYILNQLNEMRLRLNNNSLLRQFIFPNFSYCDLIKSLLHNTSMNILPLNSFQTHYLRKLLYKPLKFLSQAKYFSTKKAISLMSLYW